MRRFLFLILLLNCVAMTQAQHRFQGVSLSEALIQLDLSSKRYDISFVYDELEDFTVTKTVRKGCSLPDAVREVCGFYPVRVTTKGRDILVECIQKERTKLSGKLVDADRQPIAYANIVLFDTSDTLVIGGGVSNEAGDFVIPCKYPQVRVRISCVGFKTIERQMPVSDVGTIQMQMDNKYLKNVTISGWMPVIRNEANRLQYIVANDPFSQGQNALELMNRVPMVSMVNGHATILGKGLARYMMNGRVMEMDDEMIHQRLWSIRAEDIKCIEVITMPTGKYLTDMGGGYINIVINRDQSLGWRSDVSVQAGTSDKWSGRTNVSVNYASKQFDVALDVNGNWLTKTEDKDMYQSFFDNAYVRRKVLSHKETTDKDLGSSLTLRYLPKKNLEIGAFASYQHLWPKSDIISETFSQTNEKKIGISSESELEYLGNHVINLSAYCDWTFRKPENKLSFSYNYYQKQDNNESTICSIIIEGGNPAYSKIVWFTNESLYRIHSAKVDLSASLSDATTLNAGISYTNINNEANTFKFYTSTFITRPPAIQSDYYHGEKILAGHLSIQHVFGKNWKTITALRYEHTKNSQQWVGVKNNYLFPTLSLNYCSDGGNRMGAAWSMGVTRPNFYDLNPLMVFESCYDTSQGNPFLKPSYENRVEVSYSGKNGFYANFYHTHGKDQIDWMTTIASQFCSTSPSNAYKSDKTGLYVNYHYIWAQRVNIIAEGELFYYDAKTYDGSHGNTVYYVSNNSYVPERLFGWGKRFSFSGDLFLNRQHSLMLNARFDQWLDDYVGLSKIDAYGYFTFALRYSLLDNRLKISLTAADPFHQHVTNTTKSTLDESIYRQKTHTNLHSHYIGLTATYSLGGKKVRQIHHDFNDTEQQRAEKKK